MALYALTAVADTSRSTFGVDERWRLYVNPEKLREWPVLQVAGVLLHEVGHVVRDHAGRARTRMIAGELSRYLWNVAADAEINDDPLAIGVSLPFAPVTSAALGMPAGMVAEFYYARLAQLSSREASPPAEPDRPEFMHLPGDLDCWPGCHAQDSGQDHALLPPGVSDADALLLRRRVAEEIIRSASAHPGTMAGGWIRWAEAVTRPRLDWRKLLTAKVRSAAATVAGAADYSYARPPRRRVPRVVLPSCGGPRPGLR
jgi:Putative metallopeptidase domain